MNSLEKRISANERLEKIINDNFKWSCEDVKECLRDGADINITGEDNWTILMLAVYMQDIETEKFLIKAGANLDVKDKYGRTALIFAVGNDDLDSITRLKEAGANPDITDKYGWSALFHAVFFSKAQCVNKLVVFGADIDIVDNTGSTLFDIVSDNEVKLILEDAQLFKKDMSM